MIQQEIQILKMAARKNRDTFRVNLFSFIQGEFERVAKEVPDEKAIKILEGLITNYQDRKDYLNEDEIKELEIVQELVTQFKPQQLTEDEIKFHITQTVNANITGKPATLGEVQKFFKETFPGQYDAKLVTTLFKEL